MTEQIASPVMFREVSAFYSDITFEGVFSLEGMFVIDIAPTLSESIYSHVTFTEVVS